MYRVWFPKPWRTIRAFAAASVVGMFVVAMFSAAAAVCGGPSDRVVADLRASQEAMRAIVTELAFRGEATGEWVDVFYVVEDVVSYVEYLDSLDSLDSLAFPDAFGSASVTESPTFTTATEPTPDGGQTVGDELVPEADADRGPVRWPAYLDRAAYRAGWRDYDDVPDGWDEPRAQL